MSKTIFFFLILLASTPYICQAQTLLNHDIQKIETADWRATHIGEGLIENTEVIVAFEQATHEVRIPEYLADRINTFVPISEKTEKYWRITVASKENYANRQSFRLTPETIFIDGKPTYALINQDPESSLHFVLIPLQDGTIHVSFSGSSLVDAGELLLNPALQTM